MEATNILITLYGSVACGLLVFIAGTVARIANALTSHNQTEKK